MPKNPFLAPIFWGVFFVSGSRSPHSSDKQILYFWALPAHPGTWALPPSPSLPVSLLCSALRSFPLCSKQPLCRSWCLPGVPYFISFLWGIPLTLQDQLKCQLLKGFPWLSWAEKVHSFAQMLYKIVLRNKNFAVTLPGVQSPLYCLLLLCPWAPDGTSLCA